MIVQLFTAVYVYLPLRVRWSYYVTIYKFYGLLGLDKFRHAVIENATNQRFVSYTLAANNYSVFFEVFIYQSGAMNVSQ